MKRKLYGVSDFQVSKKPKLDDDPFMLQLPVDIWIIVFSYIEYPVPVYKSFCLVNQNGYTLMQNDKLWEMICQYKYKHAQELKQMIMKEKNLTYISWKNVFQTLYLEYCIGCGKRTSVESYFPFFDGMVCESCQCSKPEFQTVDKNGAKRDYGLTPKDLKDARSFVKPNNFRLKSVLTLYLVSDLKKIASEKTKLRKEQLREELNKMGYTDLDIEKIRIFNDYMKGCVNYSLKRVIKEWQEKKHKVNE